MSKAVVDRKRRVGRPATAVHRKVVFVLNSREAEAVYLCGDFNDWLPDSLPMIRHGDRRLWEKRLVLPPGHYEYKFIVDGVWTHNPDAGKNVPNAFGSLNSVMEVRA